MNFIFGHVYADKCKLVWSEFKCISDYVSQSDLKTGNDICSLWYITLPKVQSSEVVMHVLLIILTCLVFSLSLSHFHTSALPLSSILNYTPYLFFLSLSIFSTTGSLHPSFSPLPLLPGGCEISYSSYSRELLEGSGGCGLRPDVQGAKAAIWTAAREARQPQTG